VVVGVGVSAQGVVDFLLDAAATASFTTADTGVVEGRVVRAEVTFTAVPERGHDSGKGN
jgi:hypothetical protein